MKKMFFLLLMFLLYPWICNAKMLTEYANMTKCSIMVIPDADSDSAIIAKPEVGELVDYNSVKICAEKINPILQDPWDPNDTSIPRKFDMKCEDDSFGIEYVSFYQDGYQYQGYRCVKKVSDGTGPVTCVYKDDRINAYIKIYDDGSVTGTGHFVKDGQQVGTYHSETKIGNTYNGTTCPKYVLVTYGRINGYLPPFYVSNSNDALLNIASDNNFKLVDFSEVTLSLDNVYSSGYNVWSEILSVTVEAESSTEETKTCTYNNIIGCDDCEVKIDFWTKGSYYDFGESVVKNYSKSSNISSVKFEPETDWQKKKVSGWTTTPFSDYLSNNLCPEGLYMYYNSDNMTVNVYINELKYENDDEHEIVNPEINLNPTEQNCTTLFGSPETPWKPAYYMQIVFEIIKYAAIVLLIVLSIMDYVGAVASSDQDAMKKATTKMVTRLIICVVLFVLPTLLKVIFQIAGIYDAANCGIK